jgi:hypothetical protein
MHPAKDREDHGDANGRNRRRRMSSRELLIARSRFLAFSTYFDLSD